MRRLAFGFALIALLTGACAKGKIGTATASNRAQSPSASAVVAPTSTAVALPALKGTVTDKGHADEVAKGANVAVDVDAGDDYFSPTFIEVAPGASVTVTVKDTGSSPHTFTIAGTTVNLVLSPGQSGTATFVAPATGSVTFFCTYHQSLGMQGAVYVG